MVGLLIFLGVLSFLIFFHELGHFVAAKACGIYVHQFSIGMPPRVAGFKWGETDYCIGALPIGGFVHMAGQEDAPLSEEERDEKFGHIPEDRWFSHKPVWQRYIVILAGPFMNLFVAIGLYALIAAMGPMVPEWELTARVGQVLEGSAAEGAPLYIEQENAGPDAYSGAPDATGWKTGDRIVSINGAPTGKIMDLAIAAILGGESTEHAVVLERTNADRSTVRYISHITPVKMDGGERPRFGVNDFSTALVGHVMEGTPGEAAGLQEDDVIFLANGVRVDSPTFIAAVEKVEIGTPIHLDILRGEETLQVTLVPETIGRLRGLRTTPGLDLDTGENSEKQPVVAFVESETLKAAGIQRKDKIIEIDGQPATVGMLYEVARARPGGEIRLKVQRPAILFGLIQRAGEFEFTLPVDSVRAIGVGLTTRMLQKQVPVAQILPEGFRESAKALKLTLLTLKGLATGTVSPKDLGGPVMIAQVTVQAAEAGFFWLLNITAFISINLFVFNLLPLPVLDGGLLVIHGLEGIRRKPLNLKVQERYQQFGLVLILGLMVFVTWNDVTRWLRSLVP